MEEKVIVSKTEDGNEFHVHPLNLINGVYVLVENGIGFNIPKETLIYMILKGDEYYILNEDKTSIELLEIGIINNINLPVAKPKIYINGKI